MVLFPAPDAPTTAMSSPRAMVRSMPFSTGRVVLAHGERLIKLVTVIMRRRDGWTVEIPVIHIAARPPVRALPPEAEG